MQSTILMEVCLQSLRSGVNGLLALLGLFGAVVAGFAADAIMSTRNDEPQRASRPFDLDRDGFVMGEAAGVMVLEEFEHAIARGAKIYAEIVGYGMTADAYHITAPSPGGIGATRCMQLALEDAGLEPEDIKQINAHGTSTPLNDKAESQAIAAVFGNDGPPVVSIKGVTGHPLGAAGALELAAVMLSFEKKLIPPTRGTTVVDPEMSIDVVVGDPRPWEPGPTISNNFGFGGHNGSVIVSPYAG